MMNQTMHNLTKKSFEEILSTIFLHQNRLHHGSMVPTKKPGYYIQGLLFANSIYDWRFLKKNLWRFALLALALSPNENVRMKVLIAMLVKGIYRPELGVDLDKFIRKIRNLKSHRYVKSNFVFQGYAINTSDGFIITEKGLVFVDDYFKSYF